ncbi:Quino protein alcohol dehydrogenase-like protein [Podospora aff. communis PSN243]|uniref:Quino protein alcohol dehydrogenase-like protein n=1 Tax=Podospora aff. communis PSN243 TaxID=3040156 RepID=A0AAV9H3N1_9PEZI|nr:Quino protein alcohol dehydrogenase-like protein [Podospora aff. communis PSN243]
MLLLLFATPAHAWSGWGGGPLNNRWAQSNTAITSQSIANLTPHCNLTDAAGVSATPVVDGNTAYYPTWSGAFIAINLLTCLPLWQTNLSTLLPSPPPSPSPFSPRPLSRTSPQLHAGILFLGTQLGASVLALNASTGALLASHKIHTHPLAMITQSPTYDPSSNLLLIGTSSMEHVAITNPSAAKCCSFTGSFAALSYNQSTSQFSIKWTLPTIPASRLLEGWAGAAVWGSQPAVVNSTVYIGTGNTYSVPPSTVSCQKENNATAYGGDAQDGQDPCLPSDVLQDSIVAIDITSGKIKWARQFGGVDAFSMACGYPGMSGGAWGQVDTTICPQVPGPDADFGMAPAVVTVEGKKRLVVGRKNGVVYCLEAEDGRTVWKTVAAPPGVGGGVSWGVAADGERVYYGSINTGYLSWEIIGTGGNKTKVDMGFYGALSLRDGSVVWQTAVPKNGLVIAPPTVVGDVVLVARTGQDPDKTSSYDQTQGGLVALHAETGSVLKDYELPTNMHGGVAVRDNYLMFGTGYSGRLSTGVTGGFNVFKV